MDGVVTDNAGNAARSASTQQAPRRDRPFKGEHTRLYLLIGKRVITPKGAGKLWRVFTNSIGGILDSSQDPLDGPQDIHPLSDTRKLKEKRALFYRSSTENDR